MELWREKAAFLSFCRSFGGEAAVFRRGWVRDGDREVETESLLGRYRCLLTQWSGTDTAGEPAAQNESAAQLFLPLEADIRPGDRVEVTQHGATEGFYAAGQPQRYPVYQAVKLRKEEIV